MIGLFEGPVRFWWSRAPPHDCIKVRRSSQRQANAWDFNSCELVKVPPADRKPYCSRSPFRGPLAAVSAQIGGARAAPQDCAPDCPRLSPRRLGSILESGARVEFCRVIEGPPGPCLQRLKPRPVWKAFARPPAARALHLVVHAPLAPWRKDKVTWKGAKALRREFCPVDGETRPSAICSQMFEEAGAREDSVSTIFRPRPDVYPRSGVRIGRAARVRRPPSSMPLTWAQVAGRGTSIPSVTRCSTCAGAVWRKPSTGGYERCVLPSIKPQLKKLAAKAVRRSILGRHPAKTVVHPPRKRRTSTPRR